MENSQGNEYDYFIDRLAELVLEYYASNKNVSSNDNTIISKDK